MLFGVPWQPYFDILDLTWSSRFSANGQALAEALCCAFRRPAGQTWVHFAPLIPSAGDR
jgi:hypothetical protein